MKRRTLRSLKPGDEFRFVSCGQGIYRVKKKLSGSVVAVPIACQKGEIVEGQDATLHELIVVNLKAKAEA